MDIKEIQDLIDNKKYSDAEQMLKTCNSNEKEISIANCFIGYINTRWDNKSKSDYKAKQALLNCIRSSYPIPDAFFLYADIEEDKNIALNYLKKGLEKFPTNSGIYISLLKYSIKSERIKIITQIKEKGFSDFYLLKQVIEILISYELWDDIDVWSYKLIETNDVEDDIKNYAQLLSAYSKLLTKDRKSIIDALAIFESLVENDIQNNLYYSQYIGAIGCAVALQDNMKVKQYFDKLPVSDSIQDLNDGPDCIIEVNFFKIYNPIFDEVSKLFVNDKKRKLKNDCLRALYLYSSYEKFEKVRYTKKHINDLKRYYKSNQDNLIVGCAIFNMECTVNLFYQAYLTYMDMLNHNLKPEENYTSADTAIANCSEEDLENIYRDVCEKIDTDFNMDISILVTEIVDSIIDRIWGENEKKRNYLKIQGISEKVDILFLEKSNRLFKIAYSFAENNNPKAKRIYEMLLKKQPNHASAMNNLGVIYEQEGNLLLAKEYFNKALEIDSSEGLYSRNLNDIDRSLMKYTKALEKLKKEPIWFIGRLGLFYDIANATGEIQCTYKNRPTILKVRPDKANELVDKMVENGYIEKLSSKNNLEPVKYIINPMIKIFLQEMRSRIEKNKEYEILSEKLNIDSIEEIGYSMELIDLLDNIQQDDLREILKRDLKECAVCILTEQNKASIVMCGSIIEAILMYKVLDEKIEKYEIGTLSNKPTKIKKVIDMDINELLFVVDKEGLIKKEHFHLTHFARSYRNIIHPACEIRKGFEVSKEEATFMWDILLRIIRAVLS